MIIYDVLNDIWNDGYDIYVYYQDIEQLYTIFNVYKMVLYTNVPNIGVYIDINDILNDI